MKILKLTLLTGALLAGTVSAHEMPTGVTGVVSHLVQRAVTEVTYDVANGVYESVLNASYKFELDESPIKTQVLISKTESDTPENSEKAE